MTVRLTRQRAEGFTLLELEGHLRQETIAVVSRECALRPGESPPLKVDLARLGHVDAAGLRLLRDLQARSHVQLLNCSPLLQTLIAASPE